MTEAKQITTLVRRHSLVLRGPVASGSAMDVLAALQLAAEIRNERPKARITVRPFDWYIEVSENAGTMMYLNPGEYIACQQRTETIRAYGKRAESEAA